MIEVAKVTIEVAKATIEVATVALEVIEAIEEVIEEVRDQVLLLLRSQLFIKMVTPSPLPLPLNESCAINFSRFY